MPRTTTGLPESSPNAVATESLARRHFTHKRLERWIRLQQFVYGLPDDYSYAVCSTTAKNGQAESRALVTVGWMTWFGHGRGNDQQHSLALALFEASEALSSNRSRVLLHGLHGLNRWLWRRLLPASLFKAPAGSGEAETSELPERLAG